MDRLNSKECGSPTNLSNIDKEAAPSRLMPRRRHCHRNDLQALERHPTHPVVFHAEHALDTVDRCENTPSRPRPVGGKASQAVSPGSPV